MTRRSLRAVGSAVALSALGTFSPAALAEAPRPVEPADEATATTLRPTFRWTAGSTFLGISRYEVLIQTAGSSLEIIRVPAGTLSATPSVDLPDDATFRWFVRLVNTLGGTEATRGRDRATLTVSTPLVAPTIDAGPQGPTNVPAPGFAWTGTRVDSAWTVVDIEGRVVQDGDSPDGGGQATLTSLTDGPYAFRVLQRSALGADGPAAERPFVVDTRAPGPLAVSVAPSTPAGATPSFSWTGLEAGAIATWRVTGAAGAPVGGPIDTLAAGTAPTGLSPGAYAIEARQTDAAGNPGPWSSQAFSVAAAQSGATPKAPTPNAGQVVSPPLPSANHRRLTPRRGARVVSRRPTLRWTRAGVSAQLYNLQLFRFESSTSNVVKVLSVFPRGNRYRLPSRARLASGACYIWRVWPYAGKRFTARPLGVSNFCVARKRVR